MRSALLVLAAVLGAGLAGCSGPGPDDVPREDGATPAPPAPVSQTHPFSMDGGLGIPVLGEVVALDEGARLPFEVGAGHASLVATVEWQCEADAVCDLEVELRRGDQEVVTADFGSSPLTLEVDAPQEGRYTFVAYPSSDGSVVVGLQGTLTVALS